MYIVQQIGKPPFTDFINPAWLRVQSKLTTLLAFRFAFPAFLSCSALYCLPYLQLCLSCLMSACFGLPVCFHLISFILVVTHLVYIICLFCLALSIDFTTLRCFLSPVFFCSLSCPYKTKIKLIMIHSFILSAFLIQGGYAVLRKYNSSVMERTSP